MVAVETFSYDEFISNCYVVHRCDVAAVLVIDPFISDKIFSFIQSLDPHEVIILLTHEHFDHTTGVNEIKSRFNAKIYCTAECAEKIGKKRNNRPLSVMGGVFNRERYNNIVPYECFADRVFDGEFEFDWHGVSVKITLTPGHTSCSCCIAVENYIFSGDSLLLDIPTITRFPSGSREQYENITVPFLKKLDKNTIIMPGHGPSFSIKDGEWRGNCFVRAK